MTHFCRAVSLLGIVAVLAELPAVSTAAQEPWHGHGPRPAYHHGPPPRSWHGHGGDHDNTAAFVGGALLGLGVAALAGSALAPPPPVTYAPPPPGYYAAPPPVYYGY